MKSRFKMRLALAALLTLGGLASVEAGPLDRFSQEPRRNPAADNMLRTPGVVGLDYQGAVGVLQQAGLNPVPKYVRKVKKAYAGREGQVVLQTPAAGGVAMLGSSVSITVYDPPSKSGPGYSDPYSTPYPPAQPDPYSDNQWNAGHGQSPQEGAYPESPAWDQGGEAQSATSSYERSPQPEPEQPGPAGSDWGAPPAPADAGLEEPVSPNWGAPEVEGSNAEEDKPTNPWILRKERRLNGNRVDALSRPSVMKKGEEK